VTVLQHVLPARIAHVFLEDMSARCQMQNGILSGDGR
jgi:hypothetical protein